MEIITLVVFDYEEKVLWNHGPAFTVAYSTEALLSLRNSILEEESDYILFWDGNNKLPSYEVLQHVIKEKGNIWHVGSAMGLQHKPSLIEVVQPTNMNNVSIDTSIDHSSWKLTFRGCLLPKSIFEAIPLRNYGDSLDLIGLDFGYNAMRSGAMPRYSVALSNFKNPIDVRIKMEDELAFISSNLDRKAVVWCYILNCLRISPRSFMKALRLKNKRHYPRIKGKYDGIEPILDQMKVSIVIATLNRYKVLKEELREIRSLDPSILEIVIVDQTPSKDRDTSFLEEFTDLHIQYISTDQIGQCSARNKGIVAAKGNYIWFLDDDMKEFPSDYLLKHLQTLQEYQADISCGIPDEVGTDFIDRTNKHVFLSDGFPTNDVVVKKELLEDIGGFDETMDQLQSEDQEIGLRLVKKGALSVKNNQLRLLHLRAPMGGLRTHKVRKSTFSASRKSVFKRRLLHYSEVYLSKKHFPSKNVFHLLLLNIRGTFIVRGNIFKKIIKIIIGLILLVPTIFVLGRKNYLANQMIKK